ncbi:MAG: TrmH family RNA methyltransferase, partial [Rhizobiaceae bacterium]
MSDENDNKTMSDAHNSFHAKKRRARRDSKGGPRYPARRKVAREESDNLYLYGLHTVRAALNNPVRRKITLYATKNGLSRLEFEPSATAEFLIEEKLPGELDRMVGSDAVHQGAVLHAAPLLHKSIQELSDYNLVLILDQVTDPHNVGAIMRSAVAMNAGAIITTSRHSPVETGVLAKSASGAIDLIDHISVRNLADTLIELEASGFTTVGLDSEESIPFEELPTQQKIALVLGAEGKGLRQKTRTTCQHLVRLDMPGAIKSLNVSNA